MATCKPIKYAQNLLDKTQPFTWVNGTDAMLTQLAKGPVIVGVDATGWQQYASGIFDACPSTIKINRMVLFVGVEKSTK